jgi:Fungal specific transcription factor domain
MHLSRKVHLTALHQINRALGSDEAAYDSTLVSALIMGLFDTIVFDRDRSVESWAAHTHGTLSLLNFRGEKLLSTELGKRIYIQVAHHVRCISVQTGSLLPDAMIKLDKKMAAHIDGRSHPMVSYWPVLLHRITYMAKHLECYNSTEIIQLAVDQDSKHVQLMELTSKLIAVYGLSFYEPPTETFRKIAQEQPTVNIVRFLYTIHQLRLLRCELIYWLVGVVLGSQTNADNSNAAIEAWNDFQDAVAKVARDSAEGILTILPFYLTPDPEKPDGPLRLASVSSLVWPLTSLARSRSIEPEQRERAREALSQIGIRAKLAIATIIANEFHENAAWCKMMHLFVFM